MGEWRAAPGEGRRGSGDEAESSMGQLMEDFEAYQAPKTGDIVQGTVVSVSPEEILMDIGAKSEGVVASRELSEMTPAELSQIKPGQEILVYVLRPENRDGAAVLSIRRAELEKDWQRLEVLLQEEQIFEAQTSGYNKGGLIAHIGQIRGFVPNSQLESERLVPDGESREERLASLVGRKLRLKIIELDRDRNRLILSERAAMREWRRSQRERLLAELKAGDTLVGQVSGLAEFGAFVDLGGADGLVHLSELSWKKVSHPSEVLQVGDKVKVYVLGVDRERERISLSLRQLEPDPWERIGERYKEGQLVQGTITKLTDFGAFARLDEGVEGLIHISELAERRISHPREAVKEGEVHILRVVRIEPSRHRIALSLKRAQEGLDYVEYEGGEAAAEHKEGG